MRIATIGDIHGCIIEFKELLNKLEWLSLDEIWALGDLVDRGPESGQVVELCRKKGIKAVMGNHDSSLLSLRMRMKTKGLIPQNPDKYKSIQQLGEKDWKYLQNLPKLHIIDPLGLILVHGGVWPALEWYKQPDAVIRAQLIHPTRLENRWWGRDATKHKCGKTEEESKKEGFCRRYFASRYSSREAKRG